MKKKISHDDRLNFLYDLYAVVIYLSYKKGTGCPVFFNRSEVYPGCPGYEPKMIGQHVDLLIGSGLVDLNDDGRIRVSYKMHWASMWDLLLIAHPYMANSCDWNGGDDADEHRKFVDFLRNTKLRDEYMEYFENVSLTAHSIKAKQAIAITSQKQLTK